VPKQQAAAVEPAVFTLAELARYLNRGSSSIYRDLALGIIPSPVKIGGRQMWRRVEIDAWLDAGCPSRDEWEARRTAERSRR
jgi:predicted DNA-binding transcriptional regulator AlpA